MEGFSIRFLGSIYEVGFEFQQPPSVEIIRNDTERTIYEKPYFDFNATGTLYDDIESYTGEVCSMEGIEIFKNGTSIWSGFVRMNDIQDRYFTDDRGNYKQVEVLDANYNAWFKSFDRVKVSLGTRFSATGQAITNLLDRQSINFIDHSDGSDYGIRQAYNVGEVLDFLCDYISQGNVSFQSDHMTAGDRSELVLCNGEMIANEVAKDDVVTSWSDLVSSIKQLDNLWSYHYQIDGVEYVRIEPYEYFFSGGRFRVSNASNVVRRSALERIYTTVKIGSSNQPDNFDEDTFEAFGYDDFDLTEVPIIDFCSGGGEFSVQTVVSVSHNQIYYALLNGDTDEKYNNDLFFVETDGVETIVTTRGSSKHYNGGFTNAAILSRYYASGDASVFPNEFLDIDRVSMQTNDDVDGGWVLPGSPQTFELTRLDFDGQIQFDQRTIVQTDSLTPTARIGGVLTPASSQQRRYLEIATPGVYKFSFDWIVSSAIGIGNVDPIYVAIKVFINGTATIITSPFIECNYETKKISFITDDISLSAGDEVATSLVSNEVTGSGGGAVEFAIHPGSTWTTEVAFFPIGDLRYFQYDYGFKYPISNAEFSTFRASPGMTIGILNEYSGKTYAADAYIGKAKYNYLTGECDFTLISNNKFTISD